MRHLVISAGIVLATATVALSVPTPFGGDDSGFIPQNKLTLKCEESIAKAVGKASACVGKCTAARADGKLADDVAEDACEKLNAGKSCIELFDAAVTKAQAKDTTLACNCIVGPSLGGVIEADLDGMNDLV